MTANMRHVRRAARGRPRPASAATIPRFGQGATFCTNRSVVLSLNHPWIPCSLLPTGRRPTPLAARLVCAVVGNPLPHDAVLGQNEHASELGVVDRQTEVSPNASADSVGASRTHAGVARGFVIETITATAPPSWLAGRALGHDLDADGDITRQKYRSIGGRYRSSAGIRRASAVAHDDDSRRRRNASRG